MRTALRTYHPVPSLQKTDGNLQDAPRIKNILKSCFLHRERQNPLMTPADVLTRSRSGEAPPTTIVNLIFILASHSAMIAQSHFGSQGPYDLLDFFCPVNVSSESRANAFLWLCFHYLEAPSPNPFDDDFSRSHPGKIPRLNVLSDEETALENVDPEDEKAWGEKMMAQRREFLLNKDKEPEAADSATNGNGEPPKDKPKPRGRGKSKTKAEAAAALLKPSKRGAKGDRDFYAERELGFPFAGSEGDHGEGTPSAVSHPSVSVTPLPSSPTLPPIMPPQFPSSSSPRRFTSPRPTSREIADPYPRRHRTPTTPMSQSTNGKAVRRRQRKPKDDKVLGSPLHHSAYPPAHEYRPSTNSRSRSFVRSDAAPYTVPPPVPRRSMLEQAWHVVNTTDPLRDSEDEEEADENTRHDLLLRLRIINRLRGREPTPEPEHVYVQPVGW
ncbi:hypothetical protein NLI96_g10289 [Meripilus lineatus]|uniref:Ino eighty subunit 1 n=1 Tax=Meripilus lineatus TaxID=2056292 RepID=A0AAD5YA85_9APHY|nr:hypothetical protein NLI96_g10289 [Physisporinus lineatus]